MKKLCQRLLLILALASLITFSSWPTAYAQDPQDIEGQVDPRVDVGTDFNLNYNVRNNIIYYDGQVFTSCEAGSGGVTPISELDGFKLPASAGYTGNEDPVDENGNLTTTGERMAYGQHARLGQQFRDYYITMRWETHKWYWNGDADVHDQAHIRWLAEKPRKVLVTNTRTNRSIIAVVMESGPAPWTGVDTTSNNIPKGEWQQPQLGTAPDYQGRVSGFPPKAIQDLGAQQRTGGAQDGDKLLYAWAPNQDAPPGPTSDRVAGEGSDAPACQSGGLGVSPDGFIFPLRTTKAKLAGNPYWSPRCKNKVSSMGELGKITQISGLCHHDYLAADIQHPVGTEVVAPRPGRIMRSATSRDPCIGGNLSLYSDPALGGDGNTYYFAHLGDDKKGQKDKVVEAGDTIATIGDPSGCFLPHLHFDVSPIQAGFARNHDGTRGPLLDPQPALVAAYNNLPEGGSASGHQEF